MRNAHVVNAAYGIAYQFKPLFEREARKLLARIRTNGNVKRFKMGACTANNIEVPDGERVECARKNSNAHDCSSLCSE